jgi:hypothetical protein
MRCAARPDANLDSHVIRNIVYNSQLLTLGFEVDFEIEVKLLRVPVR